MYSLLVSDSIASRSSQVKVFFNRDRHCTEILSVISVISAFLRPRRLLTWTCLVYYWFNFQQEERMGHPLIFIILLPTVIHPPSQHQKTPSGGLGWVMLHWVFQVQSCFMKESKLLDLCFPPKFFPYSVTDPLGIDVLIACLHMLVICCMSWLSATAVVFLFRWGD